MTIFVFGNEDVPEDALPLKILPELRQRFPRLTFVTKDPNEEWDDTADITILDTVVGIDEVKVFHSLKGFARPPRTSLHDFDAYTQLLMLEKLGKIKKIKIIGVPPMMDEKKAVEIISTLL